MTVLLFGYLKDATERNYFIIKGKCVNAINLILFISPGAHLVT